MATEVKKEIALEIAHVLFIDIVGYSKLPITEQRTVVEHSNEIVRDTDQFNLKYSRRSRLARLTWTSALIPFGTRSAATALGEDRRLTGAERRWFKVKPNQRLFVITFGPALVSKLGQLAKT